MNRLLLLFAIFVSVFFYTILPSLMFTGRPEKYSEALNPNAHLDSFTAFSIFLMNNTWSQVLLSLFSILLAFSGRFVSKKTSAIGFSSIASISFSVTFIVAFLLSLIDPFVRL